jgi:hypothetical protein
MRRASRLITLNFSIAATPPARPGPRRCPRGARRVIAVSPLRHPELGAAASEHNFH